MTTRVPSFRRAHRIRAVLAPAAVAASRRRHHRRRTRPLPRTVLTRHIAIKRAKPRVGETGRGVADVPDHTHRIHRRMLIVRSTRLGTNVAAVVAGDVVAGHPPTAMRGTPATMEHRRPQRPILAVTGGACRNLFPDVMAKRRTMAAAVVVDRTLHPAPALVLVAETILIRDAPVVAMNDVENHHLIHQTTKEGEMKIIRNQEERRELGYHRRY